MKKYNKFTKDFRSQFIHVGLDVDVKERLDKATGRFSPLNKTGLINSLLHRYFYAVDHGLDHMNLP